jgi:hypothetical protein
MLTRKDNSSSGLRRTFLPFLGPDENKELQDILRPMSATLPATADCLRDLARGYVDDGEKSKMRAICLLVADLFEQGWHVNIEENKILFEPPGLARTNGQSASSVKARVRKALQIARQRQLREPAVSGFVKRMERRVSRPPGVRSSVLDLVDNGSELARDLKKIADLPKAAHIEALSKVIDPVIEFCQTGEKCRDTGLNLIDIWRYFRHTWAHEYRPIPGRQLLILIRNAARLNRPVVGIAMLASPVMRVGVRDDWIGWLREPAEARLRSGAWNANEFSVALLDRLEASIAAVRWDDLATASEIKSPNERTVLRLEQKAAGAAFARKIELRDHYENHRDESGNVRPMRGPLKQASSDTDWLAASEDLLFVRKRSELLSKLLRAKSIFQAASLEKHPVTGLESLLTSRIGQRAIEIVLTEFRKAGLSSQIADVSICGGVAPYNELLGGKLVALLLASEEVRQFYKERYASQVSIIASQLAGRAILKPADLRILTTTSLYGVGSSQYNRLILRASQHPTLDHDLSWNAIGKRLTGGFGTLHLGTETAQALRQIAQERDAARRVNNRFGEGTSPRLRQIRDGLQALGLDSNSILHHATPRLFYACELDIASRRSLLGLGSAATLAPSSADIGSAWRARWLSARVARPETLQALKSLGPTSIQKSLHPIDDGSDLFENTIE